MQKRRSRGAVDVGAGLSSTGENPAAPSAPGSRWHWPLIIVLASLTMIDIMAIDLYLPAFPEVAQSLGASTSQVQATLSVFILGLAIGQLVYGPLFDRY